MRLLIAAVGKAKRGPEQALFDTYRARFDATARPLGFKPLDLIEVEERRAGSAEETRRREGERLAAALPAGAHIVALDEHGRNQPSRALAEHLASWRDAGHPACAFLIGGSGGLAPDLLARAPLKLAFGAATWPHQLVRALLAEQLYRAATILSGHPYHRD